MTPSDFLDSLTKIVPDNNHENFKISLDFYLKHIFDLKLVDEKLKEISKNDSKNNDSKKYGSTQNTTQKILSTFENQCLLNYYDYVFLLSLISKSEHKLHLAFELLDYNGDYTLDLLEYNLLEKYLVPAHEHEDSEDDNENENEDNQTKNENYKNCEEPKGHLSIENILDPNNFDQALQEFSKIPILVFLFERNRLCLNFEYSYEYIYI